MAESTFATRRKCMEGVRANHTTLTPSFVAKIRSDRTLVDWIRNAARTEVMIAESKCHHFGGTLYQKLVAV